MAGLIFEAATTQLFGVAPLTFPHLDSSLVPSSGLSRWR